MTDTPATESAFTPDGVPSLHLSDQELTFACDNIAHTYHNWATKKSTFHEFKLAEGVTLRLTVVCMGKQPLVGFRAVRVDMQAWVDDVGLRVSDRAGWERIFRMGIGDRKWLGDVPPVRLAAGWTADNLKLAAWSLFREIGQRLRNGVTLRRIADVLVWLDTQPTGARDWVRAVNRVRLAGANMGMHPHELREDYVGMTTQYLSQYWGFVQGFLASNGLVPPRVPAMRVPEAQPATVAPAPVPVQDDWVPPVTDDSQDEI